MSSADFFFGCYNFFFNFIRGIYCVSMMSGYYVAGVSGHPAPQVMVCSQVKEHTCNEPMVPKCTKLNPTAWWKLGL